MNVTRLVLSMVLSLGCVAAADAGTRYAHPVAVRTVTVSRTVPVIVAVPPRAVAVRPVRPPVIVAPVRVWRVAPVVVPRAVVAPRVVVRPRVLPRRVVAPRIVVAPAVYRVIR